VGANLPHPVHPIQLTQCRKYDSGWSSLTSGSFTPSGGSWSKLKVARDRSSGDISLYVDGVQVASVKDATFTNGSAGLELWAGSSTSSAAPAEARFDNFSVQALP
ncbi:MAG: LamG-like jellyroll fold domain-containing protein, partial [Anaerolineales bacterium]